MLSRLLKYEIKATARTFLPLYGALLVMAIFNRLFIWINSDLTSMLLIQALFAVGYGILIVGILVITLLVIIQRYYKNLVKEEGYLMFTLPVESSQLIVSKLIVSVMWMFISTVLILLSVMIMSATGESFYQIAEGFREVSAFMSQYFMSPGLFYFELLIMSFVASVTGVLMIYASISIGSLFKNKLLGAFGAYVVIYLSVQLIMSVITLIFGLTNMNFDVNLLTDKGFIQLSVWSIIGFQAILGTAYFMISNYIFTKKLNLE